VRLTPAHLSTRTRAIKPPAPEVKPIYTPSSSVGFFVAALGLSAISTLVVILSLVAGAAFNRRFLEVAKQAAILLVGFGCCAFSPQ
jgi:hypothetical protein